MKRMNLVNVMNAIESENATMAFLTDPLADWNLNNEDYLKFEYDIYVMNAEWENDADWGYIKYCERNNLEVNCHFERIKPYDEWVKEKKKMMAKYIVN